MSEELGLTGAIAIALGGMIGGGIYAVLGVVTAVAGATTWAAFVLAGVVALCAGYSFVRLNALSNDQGGAVTFVASFTGNTTLAGMAGWTLLVGYIGSMAMYAFAFGEFALALGSVPSSVAGVPLRPVVSVLAVAAFVGLNLLGARATGTAETALVVAKVAILVGFGVAGVGYVVGGPGGSLAVGLGGLASFDPVMAAGVSFVAFQGWQLLFYDQGRIENAQETIRTAVYVSIPTAVAVYVLVAVTTVTLVPEALSSHPHTALKTAAETALSPLGLGALGGVAIAVSALFSTGSAINATLFSAAHFATGLRSDDLLPDRVADVGDVDGTSRMVLGIGAVTALFTAVGNLEAITNFASIAFVLVFAGASAIAFRHRDQPGISPLPPAVGVVGAAGFLPLMLAHLYRTDPNTFGTVVVVAVVVILVELLYFEHDVLVEEIEHVESALN